MLAIVVLGGMGSQLGVALAALTMIGGFELFRGLDQYRMLVFGVAMVPLMICGIGHRAPTVFLERNQAISSRGRSRMGDDTILFVDHLSMRFGDDLSFAAERRQITALIGPNGAGNHGVQLHHRLLQAERWHDCAHA